jgi:hypothetical protein
MDPSEFEFPPDQLDDDVSVHLPPLSASLPSPSHAPYVYPLQSVPLSMLAQLPVDQLPPTQPNNPQNFSIGQVMRGALSTAHMRSAASQSGSLSRPGAIVAPLPSATPPHTGAHASSTHSTYLSAGHPPQLPTFPETEEEGEGRNARDDGAEEIQIPIDSGQDRSGVGDTAVPLPVLSGRPSRIDWSEGEVRDFYRALSQFGTDFSAIAVLFPRRTRSDIKRLYQREMRQKPKEVQQALNQKNPIDVKAFHEQYEAKRKETQTPVKTKKLNTEELALVAEIESGALGGTLSSSASPSPTDAETEGMMAAPTAAKSRKRKRDGTGAERRKDAAEAAGAAKADLHPRHDDAGGENETFFDMAMRYDRDDNMPLDNLFHEHRGAPLDDADFAFD